MQPRSIAGQIVRDGPGLNGDHLYEIEVAGAPALVESHRMPVNTVLLTAQELARGVFQSNPVTHATWKKWRRFTSSYPLLVV